MKVETPVYNNTQMSHKWSVVVFTHTYDILSVCVCTNKELTAGCKGGRGVSKVGCIRVSDSCLSPSLSYMLGEELTEL